MRKKREEGEGKKEEGNINEPRNTRSKSDLKPQTSNPISTPGGAPNLNLSANLTNPALCMVQKALIRTHLDHVVLAAPLAVLGWCGATAFQF